MCHPKYLCFLFCAVFLVTALCDNAVAADDELKSTIYIKADLITGYNPPTFYMAFEATYKRPYAYSKSLEMVWSHLEAGVRFSGSPAATKYGVHLEWMPVALLRLRVHYDFCLFHGIFGSALPYDSLDQPYDEKTIWSRSGDEVATIGHRLWFQNTLRAKFGPVVFRNKTHVIWYSIRIDSPYVFNWEYETLMKPGDFIVENRTELLFQIETSDPNTTVMAGPYYSVAYVYGSKFRKQRAGTIVFAEPVGKTKKLGTPRIYLVSGVHLEAEYRRGVVFAMVGVGSTWE